MIVTGPQGSGNHLFSRVLSMHPRVKGWEALKEKFWVPSDEEPFAEFWVYPERLDAGAFADADYFLANVSCPFFYDGRRYMPKIREVADRAVALGVQVSIAIVVRDQNINAVQQQRVGGQVTLPLALNYYYEHLIPSPHAVHFLDHEAFFLHKAHYLRWLDSVLQFPIAWDSPDVMRFIEQDANHKYVSEVKDHWLDATIQAGRRPFSERATEN
ncbi:hypothetical protein HF313_25990 [Massilia atriviolacea]|uniref:Uncharacterized protein n=1 Tax=Massilia atriviolacea TaxID=2495579 RepID=A0A430HN29_9BURK|nr:hypothetical protein [Massilia atriviolacea]RSZ58884.1 hypothetical protein EJB06_11105 [Massilia atriviolacea]